MLGPMRLRKSGGASRRVRRGTERRRGLALRLSVPLRTRASAPDGALQPALAQVPGVAAELVGEQLLLAVEEELLVGVGHVHLPRDLGQARLQRPRADELQAPGEEV